ncbi:MAG: dihydrofolate reductase [Saprospiraceae bacterium]|nr:dihydrofolate reductase [Saprospiraceae bacterium]
MRNIIYYVATSLDGFISGPDGDISGFATGGEGVDQYLKDLQDFDTVIMGKNTYEFGYQYGLKPGQPAYPHMKHYIFSQSIQLEDCHPNVKVVPRDIEIVKQLKEEQATDIYLCGGGIFAGWLMDHGMIDILKIKLNPFLQGEGIPLFGSSQNQVSMSLIEHVTYEDGLQISTYAF